MDPFRNIFKLSTGDFLAKTISFCAFVYIARAFGIERYGVLEFALALLTYFMLLADGGLDLWATRASARGVSPSALAARIQPLRVLLAGGTYLLLWLVISFLPAYPSLKPVMAVFGLSLFAQSLSLKWVFMGRERMSAVAGGLIIGQLVFGAAALVAVAAGAGLIWIPVLRLISESSMAVWFGYLYVKAYGRPRWTFGLAESVRIVRESTVMGLSDSLSHLNYNFDSVLLGFLSGSTAVGSYNAAYRPVVALLAVPLSYFGGLFPVLARTYGSDRGECMAIMTRSLRMMTGLAVMVALGGVVWARPVILLIFGPPYSNAVVPLQILAGSAAMVILRGTCRQALNAAGRQDLDLRCAMIATGVNVGLNLVLIPQFSLVGAASATLVSESIWLGTSWYQMHRRVVPISIAPLLKAPLGAAAISALAFWIVQPQWWIFQIAIAVPVYLGALVWLQGAGQAVAGFLLPRRACPAAVGRDHSSAA